MTTLHHTYRPVSNGHACAAIFLSLLLGSLVALLVGLGSTRWLLLVGSSAALPFSLPYLLWRLPGVLPDAFSTVGFSTFRGTQDTVTPLHISLVACLVNIIANPILMFSARMGIAGVALATSASQLVAGCAYMALLLRRNLVTWASALRPPSKELLSKLAAAAGAVQVCADTVPTRLRLLSPLCRPFAVPANREEVPQGLRVGVRRAARSKKLCYVPLAEPLPHPKWQYR
jgi:hypothetical protein